MMLFDLIFGLPKSVRDKIAEGFGRKGIPEFTCFGISQKLLWLNPYQITGWPKMNSSRREAHRDESFN